MHYFEQFVTKLNYAIRFTRYKRYTKPSLWTDLDQICCDDLGILVQVMTALFFFEKVPRGQCMSQDCSNAP